MNTTTPDPSEPQVDPEADAERRMVLVSESIELNGQYILSYLHSLTRSREDAEDLYQDLFAHVFQYFSEDKIMHVGILRSKAFQLFTDRWRRHRRNPVTAVEELPESHASSVPPESFDTEDEARFKARFFETHNLNLSPEQETAVFYHCRYGYTFQEISKLMNKPASSVGDLIANAKQRFAEHLDVTR